MRSFTKVLAVLAALGLWATAATAAIDLTNTMTRLIWIGTQGIDNPVPFYIGLGPPFDSCSNQFVTPPALPPWPAHPNLRPATADCLVTMFGGVGVNVDTTDDYFATLSNNSPTSWTVAVDVQTWSYVLQGALGTAAAFVSLPAPLSIDFDTATGTVTPTIPGTMYIAEALAVGFPLLLTGVPLASDSPYFGQADGVTNSDTPHPGGFCAAAGNPLPCCTGLGAGAGCAVAPDSGAPIALSCAGGAAVLPVPSLPFGAETSFGVPYGAVSPAGTGGPLFGFVETVGSVAGIVTSIPGDYTVLCTGAGAPATCCTAPAGTSDGTGECSAGDWVAIAATTAVSALMDAAHTVYFPTIAPVLGPATAGTYVDIISATPTTLTLVDPTFVIPIGTPFQIVSNLSAFGPTYPGITGGGTGSGFPGTLCDPALLVASPGYDVFASPVDTKLTHFADAEIIVLSGPLPGGVPVITATMPAWAPQDWEMDELAAIGGDTDTDGIPDLLDNCDAVPNGPLLGGCSAQEDTDLDGYGNSCDTDWDSDTFVGISDFLLFSAAFGVFPIATADLNIDTDCDGYIGISDFLLFSAQFGMSVGPSACSPGGCSP